MVTRHRGDGPVRRLDLDPGHVQAIKCQEPVGGLTHSFYKYPARFSPQLARAMIRAFTKPGDLVLDPFCGGATTLVEAAAAKREAVGADISRLAVFLAKCKTSPLSLENRRQIRVWADDAAGLTLHSDVVHPLGDWQELGYKRHLNCRRTWRIRKSLELLLGQISELRGCCLRDFARCAVLRTGQWALDGRRSVPSVRQFRQKFQQFVGEMLDGMADYMAETVGERLAKPVCMLRSAEELHLEEELRERRPPRLVLTSPPYPGVHVLYHRWQIDGRRETAAPFWLAGTVDGHGGAHYTMGGRNRGYEASYFDSLRSSFESIRRVSDEGTMIVQVVGFANARRQLPKYLEALESVGLEELVPIQSGHRQPRRIWRQVPSRRWYADHKVGLCSAREVVLFHRLAASASPRRSEDRQAT